MNKKLSSTLALACVASFALLLGGCVSTPSAETSSSDDVDIVDVNIGTLRALSDAPLYLAMELGYFREQGLNVENTAFKNGAEMTAPLASGQIDAAAGAPNAGLFNALTSGLDISIVADKGHIGDDSSFVAFLVRNDLADEMDGLASLKGRTIGLTSTSASNYVQLSRALERVDLTIDDVTITQLDFASMGTALSNGSIDVALAPEPFVASFVAQDLATRWMGMEEVVPGQQAGILMFNGAFASELDGTVAKRFMTAYLQGVADYRQAFFGGGENYDEVVAVLTEYTSVSDATMYESIVPADIGAVPLVSVEALDADAEVYADSGELEGEFSAADYVDNSFVKAAAEELGIE